MRKVQRNSEGSSALPAAAAYPWIGSTLIVIATTLWAGIGSSVRLVQADTWTVVFWRGSFSAFALLCFAVFRFGGKLPMEFCESWT
jgi:hypothetical protein